MLGQATGSGRGDLCNRCAMLGRELMPSEKWLADQQLARRSRSRISAPVTGEGVAMPRRPRESDANRQLPAHLRARQNENGPPEGGPLTYTITRSGRDRAAHRREVLRQDG